MARRYLGFSQYVLLSGLIGLVSACGADDSSGFATSGTTTSSESSGDDGSWDGGEDSGTSDTGAGTTGTGGTSSSGGSDGTTTTGDDTGDFTDGGSDVTTDTGYEPDTGEPDPTTGGDGDGDGDCAMDEVTSLFLSPDDSNSMSSPALIKRRIKTASIINFNDLPIRRWEFLNYYHFDYTPPAPGDLSLDAAMTDASDGNLRLHLSVGSEVQNIDTRPDMNVTFVLDTSSSMAGDPMGILKSTIQAVAKNLRAGDTVSMVKWASSQNVVLGGYVVEEPNDPVVLDAATNLQPGGSSDLIGGLVAGYNLAQDVFDGDAINRIVVVTDGGGSLDPEAQALVEENVTWAGDDGIYLVSAGVYNTYYNDVLLDALSEAGKGANIFMHSNAEAYRSFDQDFLSTMSIAARDVRVRIDLPPGFEQLSFSGEESSENPNEVEPQHLAPNDTMVFQQVLEVCAPDEVTGNEVFTMHAMWKDPWTQENKARMVNFTYNELLSANPSQLVKARAILKYVDVLEAYSSTPGPEREALVGTAIYEVEDALLLNPEDADLLEILELCVEMIP